ncbi:MAG: hypothetical protein RIQ88_852 [Actinomycetota bacterium]
MIKLSAGEVAQIIDAQLVGDASVIATGSVETDSRLISAGGIFVAKPGEVTDGHLFVAAAWDKGAVIAIVEHQVEVPIVQLIVSDSVKALGLLAKFVIAEVRSKGLLQIVGVTGSNGKTTTKNMLREILSKFGPTVAPEESFNNEVGAPYSMLKIDESTRYLVVEYGAAGLGSIKYLTDFCKPDLAIELKVGLAHAGEFGGIENTQKIKAELVQALDESDVALLNFDDTRCLAMKDSTKAKIVGFSVAANSDYRATEVKLSITGTSFILNTPNGSHQVKLNILGEHHVYNALAALGAADQLGLELKVAIKAVEEMQLAERWRMQLLTRADGLALINDAYNASPDSMKAALYTLAELGRQTGRKTVAVLGHMAELGQFEADEHDAIGRLVVRLNIDQLVVVGNSAKLIHMAACLEGSWDGESQFFEEASEATAYLRGMLKGDEIVLVKSSKSANLRYLGDELAEDQA